MSDKKSVDASKGIIERLARSKRFMSVFCVVIAAVAWYVVMAINNPNTSKPFTKPVVIDTKGTALEEMGLKAFLPETPIVTVTVNGTRDKVNKITSDDITITPSYTGVTAPGTHPITLKAEAAGSNDGIESITVEPSSIDVPFDIEKIMTFLTVGQVEGVTAAEGLVRGSEIITDSAHAEMEITGPSKKVESIDSVVIHKKLAEPEVLSETKEYEGDVVLYDVDKNVIDQQYLSLGFTVGTVTVPILMRKTLPVKTVFVNAPAAYAETPIKYTLSDDEIPVSGAPDIVSQLSSVTLPPIDFREITLDKTSFPLTVTLPGGVTNRESINTVTVKFNLSAYREKTVTVPKENVIFSGKATGLAATVAEDVKNVTLVGPTAQIRALKASDVFMNIDLTGKISAGSFQTEVIFSVQGYPAVWGIGTLSAIVELK